MEFLAYIEKQKKLIRAKHEGETFLITTSGTVKIIDCDERPKQFAQAFMYVNEEAC